jgi:hypothetical protein
LSPKWTYYIYIGHFGDNFLSYGFGGENMNVNNLKVGMVIKNYKELCYLLEVNPVGGKSKILQLERLSKLIK